MTDKAFIEIDENGNVKISGGLVFTPGSCWKLPANGAEEFEHEISNNYFISYLPKWYELKKWLEILQLLRKYTGGTK